MNHLGDTNKMVETPRTDAGLEYDDTTVDDVKDFSRRLERELNEWKRWCKENEQALDDLAKVFSQQQVRIQRMEEAGDAMADMMIRSARIIERESPSALAWLRAKEDKL